MHKRWLIVGIWFLASGIIAGNDTDPLIDTRSGISPATLSSAPFDASSQSASVSSSPDAGRADDDTHAITVMVAQPKNISFAAPAKEVNDVDFQQIMEWMTHEIYDEPSRRKTIASWIGALPVSGMAAYGLSLILANDGAVQGFFKINFSLPSIRALAGVAGTLYGVQKYFFLNDKFSSWHLSTKAQDTCEKPLPKKWKVLKGVSWILGAGLAGKTIKLLYSNTLGFPNSHTTIAEFILTALPLAFVATLEVQHKLGDFIRHKFNHFNSGLTPDVRQHRKEIETFAANLYRAARHAPLSQVTQLIPYTQALDEKHQVNQTKLATLRSELDQLSEAHTDRIRIMHDMNVLRVQMADDTLDLISSVMALDIDGTYNAVPLPKSALVAQWVGRVLDGTLALGLSGFGAYYTINNAFGTSNPLGAMVGGVIYAVPMTLYTSFLAAGGAGTMFRNFALRAKGMDPSEFETQFQYNPNNLKRLRNGVVLLSFAVSYLLSFADSGLTAFEISHLATAIGEARHGLAYAMMGLVNIAQAGIAVAAINTSLQRIVTLLSRIPTQTGRCTDVEGQYRGSVCRLAAIVARINDDLDDAHVEALYRRLKPALEAAKEKARDELRTIPMSEHVIDISPVSTALVAVQPKSDQLREPLLAGTGDVELRQLDHNTIQDDDVDAFSMRGGLRSVTDAAHAVGRFVMGSREMAKQKVLEWWKKRGWGRQAHASLKVPA